MRTGMSRGEERFLEKLDKLIEKQDNKLSEEFIEDLSATLNQVSNFWI